MRKKPEILSSKIVAETRVFAIEEFQLRFSNGEERYYERLRGRRGSGSVMIAPMLDSETVLLIREYGGGLQDYFLGLPKGAIEEEEAIEVTANRELMEEVGYGAKQFHELKPMVSSAGYSSSPMRLLLATDLYPAELEGDEPEKIEVVPWSLKRLPELMARDDFPEARSVAALFLVREFLNGK